MAVRDRQKAGYNGQGKINFSRGKVRGKPGNFIQTKSGHPAVVGDSISLHFRTEISFDLSFKFY